MRLISGCIAAIALSGLNACSQDQRQEDWREGHRISAQVADVIQTRIDAFETVGLLLITWSANSAEIHDVQRPPLGYPRTSTDAPLRIASNTKTFVAVAALKLVERGQLDLDAPISDTLPADLQTLLLDGGYDVEAITARMLLQHTSGLADHAQLQSYFEQIMADPQRVWTRQDQVVLAMREGEPVGGPGERFAYSDTGYVLIGAIIENVHGTPLAPAVRSLTGMDALNLDQTWWERLESEPENAEDRFPQVAFGMPLSDIDPSVDLYGGGGLLSSITDLSKFHRLAASGALFEDPALNAALTTPSPQSLAEGESGYGMGFFIRDYAGESCLEHSGFWGTLAVYCPASELSITGAVSNAEDGYGALRSLFEDIASASQ